MNYNFTYLIFIHSLIVISVSLITYTPFLQAQDNIPKQIQQEIIHQWPAQPTAIGYETSIEVSLPQRGFRLFQATKVSKQPFIKALLPYGHYRSRFRPIYPQNQKGPWSAYKVHKPKFPQIKIITPKPNANIASNQNQYQLKITWEPNQLTKSYQVIIRSAKDPQRTLINQATVATTLTTQLPSPGVYEYTVQAYTFFTNPNPIKWHRFTLTPSLPLTTPELSLEGSTLSWPSVPKAESYILEISYKKSGLWRSIKKHRLPANDKPQWHLTRSIKVPGNYQISVTAISKTLPASETAQIEYTHEIQSLTQPKGLRAIKLKDPMPPTETLLQLNLAGGMESVNATGILGDFSGSGQSLTSQIKLESLPKPQDYMMMFQALASINSFSTKTEKQIDGNTTTQTTLSNQRSIFIFRMMGRSAPKPQFYGFGMNISSRGITTFESTDETTGEGNLKVKNMTSLGLAFHHRTKLNATNTLHTDLDLNPISSATAAYISVRITETLRWFFSPGGYIDLGAELNYINATLAKSCSNNQNNNCVTPKTQQTEITAQGGIGYKF